MLLNEIFKTRKNTEATKLIRRNQKLFGLLFTTFFLHSMLDTEGLFFLQDIF